MQGGKKDVEGELRNQKRAMRLINQSQWLYFICTSIPTNWKKKGQLEKYEQCLDTKEYQGIIVFRLNSGTKVRSSNIVAFLVIYTEIFSDEMIRCQVIQNNLGHGEVGGGTDEIRISH